MSKAFVKEDENDDEDGGEPTAPAPPGGKNYITPGGLDRLKTELRRLLDVDRPELVRVVSWAASNGDRSENGDYLYGKKKLREIDRRIRFLSKRIEIAHVVNPQSQTGPKVKFGATVTVEGEDGRKRTYSIVGIDETDVVNGRISWISPIGTALLTGTEGEAVTVKTPKGEEDVEILEVRYEDLP
ncbi:MAG TPA: transcription elongation factor GreB [Bdellovibrionota bacterium]|jgi:transcription elongation factor GreB